MKISLSEIFNMLHDAGFITTVNEDNTVVKAGLNRDVSTFEVWIALDKNIEQSRIRKSSANFVVIS